MSVCSHRPRYLDGRWRFVRTLLVLLTLAVLSLPSNSMQQVYVLPQLSSPRKTPGLAPRIGKGDGIVNAQTRKRKRKRKRPGERSETAPKGSLYISSYMPTRWPPLLVRKGVTHVLSVMSHESGFPVFPEDIVAKRVEVSFESGRSRVPRANPSPLVPSSLHP